jgi:hypothetical protein
MKPESGGQIFIQGNGKSGRLLSEKWVAVADEEEAKSPQLGTQSQWNFRTNFRHKFIEMFRIKLRQG